MLLFSKYHVFNRDQLITTYASFTVWYCSVLKRYLMHTDPVYLSDFVFFFSI